MFGKHSLDKHQDGKLTKLVEIKQPLEKFAEKEPLPSSSPLTWIDDSHIRGSYMVGGSPFGWSFITFSGSKPVYYGVTKEVLGRLCKGRKLALHLFVPFLVHRKGWNLFILSVGYCRHFESVILSHKVVIL